MLVPNLNTKDLTDSSCILGVQSCVITAMLDNFDRRFSLFAILISFNMAKIFLFIEYLGDGCTPRIFDLSRTTGKSLVHKFTEVDQNSRLNKVSQLCSNVSWIAPSIVLLDKTSAKNEFAKLSSTFYVDRNFGQCI